MLLPFAGTTFVCNFEVCLFLQTTLQIYPCDDSLHLPDVHFSVCFFHLVHVYNFFDRTWLSYTLAVFKVFPGWLFSLVQAIGLSSCHFTLLYCLTADVLSINCIINTMITLAYLQLEAAVFKVLQGCKNVKESWKVICNVNFRSWVLCQGTKGLANKSL